MIVVGALITDGKETATLLHKFGNGDILCKARIHPSAVLAVLDAYVSARVVRCVGSRFK